jgi:hypothetical protein
MKRWSVMVVIVGLLMVIGHVERVQCQPLRVGALYPVSGALALLGDESWRGAEIARQMRNQKGGVAGKQVEFMKVDIPDVNAIRVPCVWQLQRWQPVQELCTSSREAFLISLQPGATRLC